MVLELQVVEGIFLCLGFEVRQGTDVCCVIHATDASCTSGTLQVPPLTFFSPATPCRHFVFKFGHDRPNGVVR